MLQNVPLPPFAAPPRRRCSKSACHQHEGWRGTRLCRTVSLDIHKDPHLAETTLTKCNLHFLSLLDTFDDATYIFSEHAVRLIRGTKFTDNKMINGVLPLVLNLDGSCHGWGGGSKMYLRTRTLQKMQVTFCHPIFRAKGVGMHKEGLKRSWEGGHSKLDEILLSLHLGFETKNRAKKGRKPQKNQTTSFTGANSSSFSNAAATIEPMILLSRSCPTSKGRQGMEVTVHSSQRAPE